MKSRGVVGGDGEAAPNQTHLTSRHVAFLDLDRLFFDLEHFKAERGWYNLNITREAGGSLLADQSWYQLLIPAEELAFDSFEKVRLWQEIALSLLRSTPSATIRSASVSGSCRTWSIRNWPLTIRISRARRTRIVTAITESSSRDRERKSSRSLSSSSG
jgi:hypothetical protein